MKEDDNDDPKERVEDKEEEYEKSKSYKNPDDVQEIGGPKGPEPTRYGDWEKGGRVSDF